MIKFKNHKNKEGHALMTCVCIIAISSLAAGLLTKSASQKAFSVRLQSNQVKAKLISEAGIRRVFAQIKEDPSILENTIQPMQLAGGSVSFEIKQIEGEGQIIKSTGSFNDTSMESEVIIGLPGGTAPEADDISFLFDSLFFCGGNLSFISAGNFDLKGNSCYVRGKGDVGNTTIFDSTSTITFKEGVNISNGGANMTAHVITPEATMDSDWGGSRKPYLGGITLDNDIPDYSISIDTEPFRAYAVANDINASNSGLSWNHEYTDSYISASELPGGTLTPAWNHKIFPPGGVLWVEGDVNLNVGPDNIKACIIATGNITVQGSSHCQKPANGLPTLISLNGDITITASGKVDGLVYADKGGIEISGNSPLNGVFICGGDMISRGSGKVTYLPSLPSGPNGEDVMKNNNKLAGPVVTGEPTLAAWIK